MIFGCGVDIVKVERFSKLAKNDTFLKRFFHPLELADAKKGGIYTVETIAARFAAKEAFGKALGTGIGCLTLKNICVVKGDNGKPFLELYGDVKEKFNQAGVTGMHVSLSHEKEYAIAQVILEK